MKKIIYFTVAAVLAMGIWACSEDSYNYHEPNNEKAIESDISYERLKELENTKVRSLEELNAIMAEFGMPLLSQESIDNSVEKLRQYKLKKGTLKSNYSCNDAYPFGDLSHQKNNANWNCIYLHNGNMPFLNSADLVIAQQYITAHGDGVKAKSGKELIIRNSDGNVVATYPKCAFENFGSISYDHDQTDFDYVDQEDKNIVAAYILGTCN